MNPSAVAVRALLNELEGCLYDFSTRGCNSKEATLTKLLAGRPASAADAHRWQRCALFLMAYPCSRRQFALARQALELLSDNIGSPAWQARLENSSVVGSWCQVSLSFHLTQSLYCELPQQIQLFSMDASPEVQEGVLGALLPPLLHAALADRHLSAAGLRSRLEANARNYLQRLLELFEQAPLSITVKELLWQQLGLFIRVPVLKRVWFDAEGQEELFFHRGALKKSAPPLTRRLDALFDEVSLTEAQRAALLLRARLMLAYQLRETDPITYADATAIRLFSVGRGLRVALFPLLPAMRLPLESYVGYMAFKNGIPLAYGGCWMFVHRARTGIHVFPYGRGGESAWAFARVLQLYRQVYGVSQFVADPFQLGRNNADGIQSGAFWFYYRLGFRPADIHLRQQAEQEARRLQANPRYRTNRILLRTFADTSVELSLLPDRQTPDPQLLSEKLLRRRVHEKTVHVPMAAAAQLAEQLSGRSWKRWPAGEQAAWLRLLPLLEAVDWSGFSKAEQREVARLIRCKGHADEGDFIAGTQRSAAWQKLLRHWPM